MTQSTMVCVYACMQESNTTYSCQLVTSHHDGAPQYTHLKDGAHLLLQPQLVVGVQHLSQAALHEVAHRLAVAIDAVVQVTKPEHSVMGLQHINGPACHENQHKTMATSQFVCDAAAKKATIWHYSPA